MATDTISVSKDELRFGLAQAQSMLSRFSIKKEQMSPLEKVTSRYFALRRTGFSDAAAIEVSTGLTVRDAAGVCSCFGDIEDFVRDSLASGLSSAASGWYSRSLQFEDPGAVRIDGHTYSRNQNIQFPIIIGQDDALRDISRRVDMLFAYDCLTASNPLSESGLFSTLLYGPPGTGKSKLCLYAIAHARMRSQEVGIPFRYESFGPSDMSKWVGESSKILKEKFLRVSAPDGVGIFLIDDVDMVLQSRMDETSSHSGLQITSEYMQLISGLSPLHGNLLVLATTNRPDALDKAVLRRFTHKTHVPTYGMLGQYESFFAQRLPWADGGARELLSTYCFSHEFVPARLEHMCQELSELSMSKLAFSDMCDPNKLQGFLRQRVLSKSSAQDFLKRYCV